MVILRIQLDRSSTAFIAGESVSGKVCVIADSPLKCRGIRIRFSGEGYTNFQHGKVRYKTTAPYFDALIQLWGKLPDQEGPNPELPVGGHTFPFSYKIPAGCPSSYEDDHWSTSNGHIRYFCEAIIDKPWQINETQKLDLKVCLSFAR